MPTFAQKLKKMHDFCKFLILTHLTPCATMTYENICPAQRSKAHDSAELIEIGSRLTIYSKRTQFQPYAQKTINNPRPKAESTNTHGRSLSRSIGSAPGINNQ